MSSSATTRFRFGIFEVDLASGDVWKHGIRTRVHGKPFHVLTALIERRGEVVTRKELQDRLWPGDTYVEFENGLNNAISRLREALGDSADNPRFIETVPRRGYRFIAPVEAVGEDREQVDVDAGQNETSAGERRSRHTAVFGIAVLVVAVVATGVWYWLLRPAPPSLRAVAVLPFVTGTTDTDSPDEYVAFGMTDALITELSQVGALKVISQTSALRYRHTDKSLPEIAREVGVGAVVEGSVVREGDQVRITVQLIDADHDTHLWAESYRRGAVDILAEQGDLARSVARDIRVQLTNETLAPMTPPRATDAKVREAHLKGRYFMSLGTEAGRAQALVFFEEPLAIDPDHAPSHAGAADYYILTDSIPTEVAIPQARAHAEQALALDETSADARVTLAFLHYYGDWDWPAAERQFKRALELNPGHTRGRRWYGMYLAAMGRREEATEQIQRVLELDPVSIPALDSAAQVWFHTRQVDRLIEVSERLLEISAGRPQGHEHLAGAHILNGSYARALEALQEGVRVSDRDPLFLMMLAHVQGALGHDTGVRETLNELSRAEDEGFVSPFFFAIANLGTNGPATALDWLERGYESRDAYLVFLKASPWMDALRSEPRFQELLRKMNFPDES